MVTFVYKFNVVKSSTIYTKAESFTSRNCKILRIYLKELVNLHLHFGMLATLWLL